MADELLRTFPDARRLTRWLHSCRRRSAALIRHLIVATVSDCPTMRQSSEPWSSALRSVTMGIASDSPEERG